MSIKEIKKLAKETLNSSLENSAIVTALYMAFIAIMLFAYIKIRDLNSKIGSAAAIAVCGLAFFYIYLGISSFFLKMSRGEKAKVSELFKPKEHFLKFIGLELAVMLLVLICSFVIAYILTFAFAGKINASTHIENDVIFKLDLLTFVAYIPAVLIGIFFSQVPFAFLDNAELNIGTIFGESLRIMKGNAIKLVLLVLSFIGWFLLVFLVTALLGQIKVVGTIIGYLCLAFLVFYILPYILLSLSYFYNDISNHNKENVELKEEKIEE